MRKISFLYKQVACTPLPSVFLREHPVLHQGMVDTCKYFHLANQDHQEGDTTTLRSQFLTRLKPFTLCLRTCFLRLRLVGALGDRFDFKALMVAFLKMNYSSEKKLC